MHIRRSTFSDLPAMEQLYERSRAFMAAGGNPSQWGSGEPSRAQLQQDIAQGCSYLCEENKSAVATFAFCIGREPLYERIDGAWLNDLPYGFMHRMAAGGAHRGAGTFCLLWCCEQCGNLRVDTHRDNIPMQRLFLKLGFIYCGITRARDGSERLSFQKTASPSTVTASTEEITRKNLAVAAAVIRRQDQIFATQRGYGAYKDSWEFPGGKIKAGETPQEALSREIREELDAEIAVGPLISVVEYDYPEFHLIMYCYWCTLRDDHLILKEHEAARWLSAGDLQSVGWLASDLLLLEPIRREIAPS